MTDSPPAEKWFTLTHREMIHEGFLTLGRYTLTQRRFDGGVSPELTREVMLAREAAAVILYDPIRDQVVMIEQIRLPAALAGFATVTREVVAGLIEDGEAGAGVAVREVLEETGLTVIGEPIAIVRMLVSPGNTTQTVQLFCARIDSSGAGGVHGVPEEHEDIRAVVLDFERFAADLRGGIIDNAIALVAGYWLIEHRADLRRDWISV